jgi:hypothetical protein
VLYPPDCSDLCGKLKPVFLESSIFLESFFGMGRLAIPEGLEMPTEMVVY